MLVVGAGLLMVRAGAASPNPGRVYRIGFLGARFRSTPTRPDIYYDAWLAAMRDLGYVEGKNLVIEWRFADGDYARVPRLAADLAAMRLDAIVTHGTAPTLALQRVTSSTPIVFAVVVDPVGNHLVSSLARPGGNITGLSLMAEDLNAKRLELLKQLIPALSKVAVLVNPGNPSHVAMAKKIEVAASVFGASVLPVEARNVEQIEHALDDSIRQHASGLVILEDAYLNMNLSLVARAALRRRIPTMAWTPEFVASGGLVCYGTNLIDFYQRAAGFVDKILKGAKPGDLPVEQPTKIELVINRKTAKALGVTIPSELLVQADRMID